jgi:hypothetical protein
MDDADADPAADSATSRDEDGDADGVGAVGVDIGGADGDGADSRRASELHASPPHLLAQQSCPAVALPVPLPLPLCRYCPSGCARSSQQTALHSTTWLRPLQRTASSR